MMARKRWQLLVAAVMVAASTGAANAQIVSGTAPSPDPRVGLKAGLRDAQTALWNMNLISTTVSPDSFVKSTNSDLAFTGKYAIQGNYNGYMVWDISNPKQVTLTKSFYCPASQSDVSTYKNLLFVSGEGFGGRLDCSGAGVRDTVSHERLRGLRIFDITDITNPKYVGNVQTCRGSHTHTVLEPVNDPNNVYVYISGSAPVRSPSELAGCSNALPESDPASALFRIEVIKVPLAHPEQAAIVTSPRIFNDLKRPPAHGESPVDTAAMRKQLEEAKARGMYTANIFGAERVVPTRITNPLLDSIAKTHGGTLATATAADSAALRGSIQGLIDKMVGAGPTANRGPTQCHDITVYPAMGVAGGACEGYGLLLDISNPENPVRLTAVSDSNFSYWHSATFNNDATKVLFSDEWGGGGAPKCRAGDPKEWGADALFTINNKQLQFQSYYKMSAPQTPQENCVAHNGSIIPVPGRDIMVQSWYQGGVSVFDWTDPKHPKEIAFFDRGPADSTRMAGGGTWSVYWYNGKIVSSEISRGLDILELLPNPLLSQNEIDAAKTITLDHLNVQGQPHYVWPSSFALARAYVDQLERNNGLSKARVAAVRKSLDTAESGKGMARQNSLKQLAMALDRDAKATGADSGKIQLLAHTVRDLAK